MLSYGLTAFTSDIRDDCPKASPKWYHVPWLTFSFGNTETDIEHGIIGSGREPICGLTQERPAPVGFLHKLQTQQFQTWAVGSFNETGGVLLGQTWKNKQPANLTNLRFDNGSFVMKFLFTEAGSDQVPYLLGSPEWHANIYPSVNDTSQRVDQDTAPHPNRFRHSRQTLREQNWVGLRNVHLFQWRYDNAKRLEVEAPAGW